MDADFLIIRKIKSGDEAASDMFVRKYYEDILKYCCYHCINQENAQDLTQEVFIRFFANLAKYKHEGKAKNYLYRIAANLCIDDYRKRSNLSLVSEAMFDSIGKEDSAINQTENQVMLEWALKQLEQELKEVIILYYFQELKIREIADVLQIGIPLTKYRLKQAKERLHELIGKEDGYES